jgi:hypothetical protein
VNEPRHLKASHIKPWRDATDAERLDGSNGLLLSPHIDHLFDEGYITFSISQELKLRLVVHQPVEIEQALVDDILVRGPLVLDDDGRIVLIDAEGVNAPTVSLARAVFRLEKPDAKKSIEVTFNPRWTPKSGH